MSDKSHDDISRRNVLRKVGVAAAAGVGGVAVSTKEASAYTYGTRVELVGESDHIVERKECCGGCWASCCGGYRTPGIQGTVVGECGSYEPHGMDLYFVDWDEEDTGENQMDASYMDAAHLRQISP